MFSLEKHMKQGVVGKMGKVGTLQMCTKLGLRSRGVRLQLEISKDADGENVWLANAPSLKAHKWKGIDLLPHF